jgi:hypothetical protein
LCFPSIVDGPDQCLLQLSQSDVEACQQFEVIIAHKVLNDEFTVAFVRPELIAHARDISAHYTNILDGAQHQNVLEMRKALLVELELDRERIAYVLALAALLSVGISLTVWAWSLAVRTLQWGFSH